MIKKIFYVILIVVTFIIASPILAHAEEVTTPTKPENWWSYLGAPVECQPYTGYANYGDWDEICGSKNDQTFEEFINTLWEHGYSYTLLQENVLKDASSFLEISNFSWYITHKPAKVFNKSHGSAVTININTYANTQLYPGYSSSEDALDRFYWRLTPWLTTDGKLDHYEAEVVEAKYESSYTYYFPFEFNRSYTISDQTKIAHTYTNYNLYYKYSAGIPSGSLFYEMTYGKDYDVVPSVPDPTPMPTPDYSGELGDINDSLGDINDYITDDTPPTADLDQLGNVTGLLPAGPVDSLLNIPFIFLSVLTTSFGGVCVPITGDFVFNSDLTLPCFSELFYDEVPETLLNFLSLIPSAFILISYFKHLYKKVDRAVSMETTSDDEWGVI